MSSELYIEALSLAFQHAKNLSKNINLLKSIARALHDQGIAVPEGTESIAEKEATLIAERETLTQSIEATSWNWNHASSTVSVCAYYNKVFFFSLSFF